MKRLSSADASSDIPVGWPQLYVCTAGGYGAFYLLYALIPYLGARIDGGFAAGLLTFAFMAATLPMQLAVPALSRRVSDRTLTGLALALLGLPSLAYVPGTSLAAMVAITIVRGMGFGLFTVISATVFTAKASAAARGKTAGRYGVIAATTGVLMPSAGLWLYSAFGRLVVFPVASALPVLALWSLTGPWHGRASNPTSTVSVWRTIRTRDTLPLSSIFVVGASLSAMYSFLPLRTGRITASWILIAFGVAFAISRTIFGAAVDRASLRAVILVSSTLAALGVSGLALSTRFGISVVSAVAMGGGLGGLATATLVYMVDDRHDRKRVVGAALWNVAYDTGGAVGGIALGATIPVLSSSGPFLILIIPFVFVMAAAASRFAAPM